jgi:hypothetical protein
MGTLTKFERAREAHQVQTYLQSREKKMGPEIRSQAHARHTRSQRQFAQAKRMRTLKQFVRACEAHWVQTYLRSRKRSWGLKPKKQAHATHTRSNGRTHTFCDANLGQSDHLRGSDDTLQRNPLFRAWAGRRRRQSSQAELALSPEKSDNIGRGEEGEGGIC